ncbi:vWA domain-containing protein [Methylomonas sp. AM2-LC]|uniref:vWA domain-containing protein n=1 Tax=Methylomonas sp. AM2-LC TaxID=3153301 RepID=UPI003264FA76
MKLKNLILCSLLLLIYSQLAYSATAPAVPDTSASDEIQLLIDVSGSMKQNDPQNQRIEASKLFINLLPDNSKVSLWLFAEKSSLLLHSDAVDANWKKQAIKETANIHSKGLFTHIENAIETALSDGFTGNGKKHLILLTDGIVDISKDIMVSADSRERVLSEWIPKLQQKNIKVDTIALSDQADKELLYQLAYDTGGWTESAVSAEQLQRVFLKMLLKAAPKDNLPLVGNRFVVDKNIKEFSILAFKKPDSAPSKLFSPDQKIIDKHTALSNVSWLETATYDLITVKQPAEGEWRLDADADPDNQVMIMTDLKMQIAEVPTFIAQTEALPLKLSFTEQDKLINHADFLGLLTLIANLDKQPPVTIAIDKKQPGYFTMQFTQLTAGNHQVIIQADGKTFKREIIREFSVVSEAVKLETEIDTDKRSVTFNVLPDLAMLDSSSLVISTTISRTETPAQTVIMPENQGKWSITIDKFPLGTETLVNFDIQAKGLDGKALSPLLKPVRINDSFFSTTTNATTDETDKEAKKPGDHDTQAEGSAEHDDTDLANSETTSDEKTNAEPTDWLEVGGIVALVNILFLVGGYLIFRAVKKATLARQTAILERLS